MRYRQARDLDNGFIIKIYERAKFARKMKRMWQGIYNAVAYTIGLCLIQTRCNFFDGDPTIIGVTDVGSDVGTGNAEICLITANSLKQV